MVKLRNTVSSKLENIGIETATIIIFPLISILLAIALSPESLHKLTANSVKIAIPVILIKSIINFPFTEDLFANVFNNLITSANFSKASPKIKIPAIIDMYIANSGLYCFIINEIITAISPIAIILIISNLNHILAKIIKFDLKIKHCFYSSK